MNAATPLTLQPLREVRLYGELGRQFGRVHRVAVETAAEAVRALCTLHPKLRQAIRPRGHYRVLIGRGERRHAIDEQGLSVGLGSADCVRIVPVVAGAKRAGGVMTIIGATLMVVGAVMWAYGIPGGSLVFKTGATLVLAGVIQMLSPQRKTSSEDGTSTASYAFNGPVNVPDQGGPVPLVIGRCICGSVVASSGLYADDISVSTGVSATTPQLAYDQSTDPGVGQSPADIVANGLLP